MTNHLIIKTIEHKGIKIAIKVDFDSGTVSLVEPNHHTGDWKAKQYLFAGRGLEYMNGWQNILEAMLMAVKEGKKMLEADLAEKSRLNEDKIVEALIKKK